MAKLTNTIHPVTIDKPMVLIPVEEYLILLEEAGYKPTPKLDREITQARARFRNGKTIPWKSLKRELK
ncbi:MAG: hypothetical protein JYX80_02400 [Candidatus Scalindua sediminis]|jgi:hypothetical protein|nr:hypothetical protein [Candidatus Scalindua sediminis]HDY67548.1 hypothetical protein [Candidatus Scalindua sp.]